MADLTITALLDGTTDLQLQDPTNGLELVSFDVGGREWDFRTAESDFVHGELRTSGKMREGQASCVVKVTGTSIANFVTRRDALLAAFAQWDYTLTFTVGGSTLATMVQCSPADVQIVGLGGSSDAGRGFNKFGLMVKKQEYGFIWRHKPL